MVGGQLTITDTWSQDRSAGLSLGGEAGNLVLNTSGTQVWENSRSQFLSKVVKMTIPPTNQVSCETLVIVNQKSLTHSFEGALVAQVTYKSTNGTLQVGNE